MNIRDVVGIVTAVIMLHITVPCVSFAGDKPFVDQTESGVAIRGYDPVAYFAAGTPQKGLADFSVVWKGATWYFATKGNLALFRTDPAKYAPALGGYCAYAVSRNYTYTGDPEVWKMVDGKLYFNANSEAQKLWEQDIPGNIRKGNKNWPAVLGR